MDHIRQDPMCDRDVTVFGYLRGTNIRPGAQVHIAGVGDCAVSVFYIPVNSKALHAAPFFCPGFLGPRAQLV